MAELACFICGTKDREMPVNTFVETYDLFTCERCAALHSQLEKELTISTSTVSNAEKLKKNTRAHGEWLPFLAMDQEAELDFQDDSQILEHITHIFLEKAWYKMDGSFAFKPAKKSKKSEEKKDLKPLERVDTSFLSKLNEEFATETDLTPDLSKVPSQSSEDAVVPDEEEEMPSPPALNVVSSDDSQDNAPMLKVISSKESEQDDLEQSQSVPVFERIDTQMLSKLNDEFASESDLLPKKKPAEKPPPSQSESVAPLQRVDTSLLSKLGDEFASESNLQDMTPRTQKKYLMSLPTKSKLGVETTQGSESSESVEEYDVATEEKPDQTPLDDDVKVTKVDIPRLNLAGTDDFDDITQLPQPIEEKKELVEVEESQEESLKVEEPVISQETTQTPIESLTPLPTVTPTEVELQPVSEPVVQQKPVSTEESEISQETTQTPIESLTPLPTVTPTEVELVSEPDVQQKPVSTEEKDELQETTQTPIESLTPLPPVTAVVDKPTNKPLVEKLVPQKKVEPEEIELTEMQTTMMDDVVADDLHQLTSIQPVQPLAPKHVAPLPEGGDLADLQRMGIVLPGVEMPDMAPSAAQVEDAMEPVTELLPIEQEHVYPPETVAKLESETPLQPSNPKYDPFYDTDCKVSRDDSNLVNNVKEMVARVNAYEYAGSAPGKIGYYLLCVITLSWWYWKRRVVIPAGQLGHFKSSGRHMLKQPGIHTLDSMTERWLGNIPIDCDSSDLRLLGMKTLVFVPENYIAGAIRRGKEEDDEQDGEYVLLPPGRHVLDKYRYRCINMVELKGDEVKIGPVTILYVKDGHLAGAYERNKGTYRIFYPGPAVVLNQKDYENIELKKVTIHGFGLGPVRFVTVTEGHLCGAFQTATGLYTIFPPGHTYSLHEKDYTRVDVVKRSDNFILGPYHFITVHKGYFAGVWRKKKAEFLILPPGNTYQLNQEDFEAPLCVKRDSHWVKCGPLSIVTVHAGILAGAFRIRDGAFEVFKPREESYWLHQSEYHSITIIPKYDHNLRTFGIYTVVTIPEGYYGIFERQGVIEARPAGFYQLASEYKVRASVPTTPKSDAVKLTFLSKDFIEMELSGTIVWRVVDPVKASICEGKFDRLQEHVRSRAETILVKLCREYTRQELLPTKQDALIKEEGDSHEEEQALILAFAEKMKQTRKAVENACMASLVMASENSAWGIGIISVMIDNVNMVDTSVSKYLDSITENLLEIKVKQANNKLDLTSIEQERVAAVLKVNSNTAVQHSKLESDLKVLKDNAIAQTEIDILSLTNAARTKARTKEIELESRRSMCEGEQQIASNRLKVKAETARVNAENIRIVAEAKYKKELENLDVLKNRAAQSIELEKVEISRDAAHAMWHANWDYPDRATAFREEIFPKLTIGTMTGEHLLDAMHSSQIPATKKRALMWNDHDDLGYTASEKEALPATRPPKLLGQPDKGSPASPIRHSKSPAKLWHAAPHSSLPPTPQRHSEAVVKPKPKPKAKIWEIPAQQPVQKRTPKKTATVPKSKGAKKRPVVGGRPTKPLPKPKPKPKDPWDDDDFLLPKAKPKPTTGPKPKPKDPWDDDDEFGDLDALVASIDDMFKSKGGTEQSHLPPPPPPIVQQEPSHHSLPPPPPPIEKPDPNRVRFNKRRAELSKLFSQSRPSNLRKTYANQLRQLNNMGFTDQEKNINCLWAVGGNVQEALEKILST